MNAHSTLWHSYTDYRRGQLIADVISNSDHITLNTNTPTRVPTPHYNQHIHQISPRCLTHCTTGHRGQLKTHYYQTTYPSSPQLTYVMTTDYNKTDGLLQTTRKPIGHNLSKTQSPLSLRSQYPPTYTANITFTNIILMADKHNIPNGKINYRLFLLDHMVCKITKKLHEESKHR